MEKCAQNENLAFRNGAETDFRHENYLLGIHTIYQHIKRLTTYKCISNKISIARTQSSSRDNVGIF